MEISCEECENTFETSEMEVKVLEEGEEINEDEWFLDADFEVKDEGLPLKVNNLQAYCPDHNG